MNVFDRIWHDVLRRPYKLVKSVDVGSGPTILLIHGIGASGKTWEPLVRKLTGKQWHLLAYDLLGFGSSPKPENKTYDVRDHADTLLASIDRKTKAGKFIIIGHSMGCLVASHIAWQYPGMVDRLILYEPPLFADSPEFRSHKRRRQLYFAFYTELLKRPKY